MDSSRQEFRQGASSIVPSVVFTAAGLLFASVGLYHVVTGTPMIFGSRHQSSHVGSQVEVALFTGFGLFFALAGSACLVWCVNARVILEPEGIAIRNMFGTISARIPWESVIALEAKSYRGRPYYVLRTATKKYQLS